MLKGIDISSYQKGLDYNTILTQSATGGGIDFAILKTSEGAGITDNMLLTHNAGKAYWYQDGTSMNHKRLLLESLGVKNIMVWHLGGNNPWFTLVDEPTWGSLGTTVFP